MTKGWLIDVDADLENNCIISWIKSKSGVEKFVDDEFHPSFYVHSPLPDLKALESELEDDERVRSAEFDQKRLWLGEKESRVLRVTVNDYSGLWELAKQVDERGDFSRHRLFNVDLSIPLRYMLDKDIFPMALMEVDHGLRVLDDAWSIDYEIPELIMIGLKVEIDGTGKIPRWGDPISKIQAGDHILAEMGEKELLCRLMETIREIDPDVIYTDGGDSFTIPYLFHRAGLDGIKDFHLGREKEDVSMKTGKSYFSYGQIKYKPSPCHLMGRIHMDRDAFLYGEIGLYGLIELSRLSRIPLQTLSRATPGTAVTAMQIRQALEEGTLIAWKKNVPEAFKTAEELLIADRGCLIYEPVVGIHENVVEIDFSSLYPNIMVKYNISPETVLCDCCKGVKNRVPSVNYNICVEREGLIPKVLRPLIERRMEYKRRIADQAYSGRHRMYAERASALKWVLVTSFGYTGYRNARFGRIECHEAISAYSREILLATAEIAEELGYSTLHGILDSLWLELPRHGDLDFLCSKIYESIGITIGIEGIYKWIVFLPNKTNGAGSLNRYYGLFDSGELKVRGIELRRRDTPPIIKMAQMDMLRELAKAEDADGFHRCIPDSIEVLRKYADMIRGYECELEDLVFTSRISKSLDGYDHFSNNVASLFQLRQEGVELSPGQTVRYIITNSSSRKPFRRVKVWELADGSEQYDREKYLFNLMKAGESLLLPFGFTAHKLAECMKTTSQTTL